MRPIKIGSREKIYIYGKHALEEALASRPEVVKKVFLAPEVRDATLRATLEKHAIPVSSMSAKEGASLAGHDAVHQGVIAVINPSALLVPFADFLRDLDTSTNPAIAILGEVQDPHNVGAIIRSAAAFGLAGVLIPEHHTAGVTGTVVKTSAGMTFRVPLVAIGNVNAAIEKLKERGFWIYGLSMEGSVPLANEAFDSPTAFVIGNEGSGIRQMTLEHCDVALAIPMHTRTESLNAAVSAGIVFYAWSAKHPEALAPHP